MSEKKNNLTYSDIEDIVEELVRVKCGNYTFDVYDKHDIAQEIRILCLKALKKFEPKMQPREKWINFFGRCVDNGLMNLKRDKYVRPTFSHKKEYENLDEKDDGEEARKLREKHQQHQAKIKTKLAIRHAMPIDGFGDIIQNRRMKDEMAYKDLELHLLEQARPDIIDALRHMLNGEVHLVKPRDKKKVRAFVDKVLSKHEDYC